MPTPWSLLARRLAVPASVLAAGTALLSGCGSPAQCTPAAPPPAPYKFGVIADVQYSRSADSTQGGQLGYAASNPASLPDWPLLLDTTLTRRYVQALAILRQAVESWRAEGVPVAVLLGDVLDKTAKLPGDSVEGCLRDVQGVLALAPAMEKHLVFGNNDAATVGRAGWVREFTPLGGPSSAAATPSCLYYAFSPSPGLLLVLLDAYDLSTLEPASGQQGREQAEAALCAANPLNYPSRPSTPPWQLMSRQQMAHMHYNGQPGSAQMAWLQGVLQGAQARGQKVFVFSHLPVHPHTAKPDGLAWNAPHMRQLLQAFPCVQAYFAGHDHDGGYSWEEGGPHYIVPPAPLECGQGQTAYGTVRVGKEGWELDWVGKTPPPGSATLRSPLQWPVAGRVLPYRQ
jgi:manganese-dependent ADP-ribose/CDP-alcohol diphosphatase